MIFQFSKDDIFLAWKTHVYWLLKSSCFELSGDGKCSVFWAKKNDGNMIFTNYWKVLVLNFPKTGKKVFFEPKSWWKDDIYWLLENSCFGTWKVLALNFFELGNTVFFWAKKLMERWYLLGLFELSKIFQDLRNMVFRAVLVHILKASIKKSVW